MRWQRACIPQIAKRNQNSNGWTKMGTQSSLRHHFEKSTDFWENNPEMPSCQLSLEWLPLEWRSEAVRAGNRASHIILALA